MTKVRVAGFSLSLDGFGAGPEQSIDDPLGKRGMELHRWFFGTKTFRAMRGEDGGSEGVDEAFARRSMEGFGAFILAAICSDRCAGNGPTIHGKAGGATTHPITRRCSC